MIEAGSGMTAGRDFHRAFSPEREDPVNPRREVAVIPKVVGGYTPACIENIFRSVNIALVNELKMIYAAMGIDIWEVVAAAKTKPFGFMAFQPGPGLGGHCIPIDPFYLTGKAREYGQHTRFIELAGAINTAMPACVVAKVGEALNEERKSIKGSKVLVVGLAYKGNVDDDRESPSYELIESLSGRGAEISYYDPYIPVIRPTRRHSRWEGTRSVSWDQQTIAGFDLVLIATRHDSVRYDELAIWSRCIVDTRNAMAEIAPGADKIWKVSRKLPAIEAFSDRLDDHLTSLSHHPDPPRSRHSERCRRRQGRHRSSDNAIVSVA